MAFDDIYRWAKSQPDKAAMIYNGQTLSYATLARGIEASRRFLERLNPPAGMVAIVVLQNIADSWINIHALRALGLTTICVPNIASARALKIRNAACIVTTEAEQHTQTIHESDLQGMPLIVMPSALYANIFAGEIPQPPIGAPPLGGHILYTSGTTGSFKKVLMEGHIEKARNEARALSQGFDMGSIDHGLDFGIWSGAGFKQPSAIWHAGGTEIIDQRPDAIDHFFDHRFTKTGILPIAMDRLIKHQEMHADFRRPSFDFQISHSGGFMTKRLADKVVEKLTPDFQVTFSATEFIRVPLTSKYETLDDLHWLKPVAGSAAEIVNDNDAPCPAGEEGYVRVLLTDVDASGYLDDPDATARFFRHGYFYPGDLGVQRADGAVRILGRSGDVLNVRGSKLAVAPLEQRVQEQLNVETVCLFSGLDKTGVEELVVVIEGERAPSRDEMQKLTAVFSQFERLRFEMMRKFPRTEAGMQKIKRAEIRKLVFPTDANQGDTQ